MVACLLATVVASSFLLASLHASEPAKPNILLIMSDDHAAHAIGAYGGRLASLNPTPTIDQIAADGIRLKNCFCVNAICTPSRATIITGQYSHINGCKGFREGLPPERQMLPMEMKRLGYETAIIGKWHLIDEPKPFDYYYVLPGQGSYFNPTFCVRGKQPWPNNTVHTGGYDCIHSSDAITNASLQWLKNREAKDKPFFLMHHFKAPHDNFENAERYDWLYQDVDIPEPDTLWNRGEHGPQNHPQYGTSVGPRNSRRNMGDHMFVEKNLDSQMYTRTAYQRYLKKYLRCVKGVDDNIARLINHLKSTGEYDNTIVIYTSDQGFMLGEHDYIDKRWMYEEALRMPFIIRFPDKYQAGTTNDDIINNTDFAPTILQLAGETNMPDSIQGRSFLPNLRGETPDDWRDATYYRYWLHMAHHDNPAHYGVRTKTHKLIFFYGLPCGTLGAVETPTEPYWELYDLVKDPFETRNVYGKKEYAQVQQDLKAKLLELKAEFGDDDQQYPELMQVRERAWK
jgi:arylsulfatase A-like enzyme